MSLELEAKFNLAGRATLHLRNIPRVIELWREVAELALEENHGDTFDRAVEAITLLEEQRQAESGCETR